MPACWAICRRKPKSNMCWRATAGGAAAAVNQAAAKIYAEKYVVVCMYVCIQLSRRPAFGILVMLANVTHTPCWATITTTVKDKRKLTNIYSTYIYIYMPVNIYVYTRTYVYVDVNLLALTTSSRHLPASTAVVHYFLWAKKWHNFCKKKRAQEKNKRTKGKQRAQVFARNIRFYLNE